MPTAPKTRKAADKKAKRKKASGKPAERPSAKRKSAAKKGGGAGRARPKRATKRSKDGCAGVIEIVEQVGTQRDAVQAKVAVALEAAAISGAKKGKRKGAVAAKGPARSSGNSRRISAGTCRAMAAVGHEIRAKLLTKLLDGPATYKTLKRAARQEAGPLYHHISQLRLAGLILPKQRGLYELTRGGRNLILAVMALSPLIKDGRRRPVVSS